MKNNNFYITTTLPYVNSDPHIGFAMEIIRADAIARCKKLQGYNVFFNTGTDEHGVKIFRNAEAKGITAQTFVDENAKKFKDMLPKLGILPEVNFIRTTDVHHVKAAQEFWKICDKNGYIYKKNYTINYCSGCELEKTNSDLTDGKCPFHPNLEIEYISEENYFFKFSVFQEKLLNFYKENKNFVIPDFRFKEIKTFVERGLQDFSISRLKEKMPWGIEVPGDTKQVMYVWFDALVNYISAIGWPDNMQEFNKWHTENGGMVQYCGKDNLRQQASMWQAMLMAAGLSPSKTIVIDGFITGAGGIKMSKSLGNTIDPNEIVSEYGTDALRYYLLREISSFEDSPFTKEMFKDAYNANLANGLGNLSSRILTLSEKYLEKCLVYPVESGEISKKIIPQEFFDYLEEFDIKKAMDFIWDKIQNLDKKIQETQPFKVIKTDEEIGKGMIEELVLELYSIAQMLGPVMPETNEKLKKLIIENKKPETPLFLRKE